jgi:Spy/CpxP family protein refolding chaperone
MSIARILLIAATLCIAAPALAQSTDQTPTQGDQTGKPHSGHHHHKKPQDNTDSTTAPSPGH